MNRFAALLLVAAAPWLAQAQPHAQGQTSKHMSAAARKAAEERKPIENEPLHDLSPAELEVARTVHVGTMACELGASVTVLPSSRREGFFVVTTSRGHRFFMHPSASRTGAVRLEDPHRGAMWLQLGNKSMLMSQKLGQRLADECRSPAQDAVEAAMKKNPLPSILEPTPAASAAAPAQ